MGFNREKTRAGGLGASEGVDPGGRAGGGGGGGGKRRVLDGPFIESKELIGGFYLVDVKSQDEAVQWALRAPVGAGFDAVLTVHPLTGAADIPEKLLQLARDAAPTWTASLEKEGRR